MSLDPIKPSDILRLPRAFTASAFCHEGAIEHPKRPREGRGCQGFLIAQVSVWKLGFVRSCAQASISFDVQATPKVSPVPSSALAVVVDLEVSLFSIPPAACCLESEPRKWVGRLRVNGHEGIECLYPDTAVWLARARRRRKKDCADFCDASSCSLS